MNATEMRRRAEEVLKRATALTETAGADERDLTVEEHEQLQAHIKEHDDLLERANTIDGLEQRQGAAHVPVNDPPRQNPSGNDQRESLSIGEVLQMAARSSGDPRYRNLPVSGKVLAAEQRAVQGQSEGTPSKGGHAVGTDDISTIMDKVHENTDILGKCTTITVGPNSDSISLPYIDETSRAADSRWGGLRAFRQAEGATITASTTTLGKITLELENLTALVPFTDQLLKDAPALTSWVLQTVPKEFAFTLNDEFFNGDGAGHMLGVMNSPALVTVPKETGQTAATIKVQNILKMFSRCYGPSRAGSAWYVNQDIEPELWGMTMPVGTGGAPVYLPPNGLAGEPYGRLLGRPVIPVEACQTLGTTGDIVLCNPEEYLTIEKGGVDFAESMHVYFTTGQTLFRFVMRNNGQPLWNDSLTPFKGTNTQSPFVALATR